MGVTVGEPLNYDSAMKSAVIFVDNLRIGGIQRLAIDEAYELSDMGICCTIVTQEDPKLQNPSLKYFSEIEKQSIEDRNIDIKILNPNRFKFLLELRSLLNSISGLDLIISHSFRASFALKILKLFVVKHTIVVNTKIHQIPTLVDRTQRLKRFIYAQFTDQLFCFSEAVRASWPFQFGKGISNFVVCSQEITLLRNGVYLPRLPELRTSSHTDIIRPRLIFLGRPTFWKGLGVLERLAQEPTLLKFDFLFVIPTYEESSLNELSLLLGTRMQVITGKSVGELEIFVGDIHLYPTQYGENSPITESISLNCLELLGVGIPSIVTAGGQITWTEEDFKEVFLEADWSDMNEVLNQINIASNFVMDPSLHSRLRNLIDIKNEINFLRARLVK